ncbi:hypothetical protein BDN70DRAFT_992406 [Pholiota conissans]|uniref:F-box domain-containing protein n=1 Tax=Pholiota conissans TaxID=109636 RepID=A0A9P6D2L9_9AGAR|nr:hypothetical protein BDN70DRAFT_992406 [Pholiota conissans]
MPKILSKNKSIRPTHAEPRRSQPKVSKSRPSKQNSPNVAPILRLPPEILCEIFAIVKKRSSESINNVYPMRWIRLTHVCRHWRAVAFASPSLWASNPWPFKNLVWLKQIIVRSKEAPLSLDGHVYNADRRPLQGFLLVLRKIQRVKHLAIRFDAREWHHVQSKLPGCAPLLEHLTLNCNMRSDLPSMKLFGPEEPLHMLPKLRYLQLQWFSINWNTLASFPGLHSLTHLKLGGNSPPTWQQLPSILKALLNLEDLDLEYSLPIYESRPHHRSHPLHFPNLRSLALSDKGRTIEAFLTHISFPTSTIVEIVSHGLELDHLPPLLSQLFRSLSGSCLQSFILHQDDEDDDDNMRLTLYHETFHGTQMLEGLTIAPRLTLHFQDTSWYHQPRTSMKATNIKINRIVFNSQLLQNISCVYLERVTMLFNPAAFAYTLGELKTVRSIVAKGLAADAFIMAMNFGSYTVLDIDSVMPSVTSLYFPNLSSVCLLQVDFSPPPTPRGIQNAAHTANSVSLMQQLQVCLAQRQESGTKLEKLTLRLCHKILEDDIVTLEAKAGAVDWDHEDIEPESEYEEDYSEDNIWNRRYRGFARDDEEEEEEEDSEEDEDSEEAWGRQMTSDEEADLAFM